MAKKITLTATPKVAPKLTEKETYREYIQKNKKLFKQGTVFADDVLVKAFGISHPKGGQSHKKTTAAYGKFALDKLSVQRKLNELLHQRGLRLSTHNYTHYRVKLLKEVTKDGDKTIARAGCRVSSTKTTVSRLRAESQNKTDRSQELLAGAVQYRARWSKMTDKELEAVKWYYS